MKPVAFAELAVMPLLRHYEEAFYKATGVSLRLVPPEKPKERISFGKGENAFCTLVGSIPAGCNACLKTQACNRKNTAENPVMEQHRCFAGLTEVTLPVMIGGRHVATLISGQIFRRKPNMLDFEKVVNVLKTGLDGSWKKKARKAYFETPVIPREKLQAVIYLMGVFASHLVDDVTRHSIASSDREPGAVSSAKEYVQGHSQESITLKQVLEHAHVSRFYFCRIFKKTTGMTFTEYVARVRVTKAKALLANRALRISEIVFAAGFGSIPQFNNVFKRFAGMPPSLYRTTLYRESPIGLLQ